MLSSSGDRSERGSALIGAVALMILASFVMTAIMVSTRSSQQGARDRHESSAAEQLARDAGTVLAAAYSAVESGEHDGFVPRKPVLDGHVAKLGTGAAVIANASLPAGLQNVDTPRVPAASRFTVRQSMLDQRYGYWQVYSARLPRWGRAESRGGRVVVYVRTWTAPVADTTRVTKPVMYRLEFRPVWFADFQMLFDGPVWVGPGATLSGRVHSNGYRTSFYNQYGPGSGFGAAEQIRIDPASSCSSSARVSTSKGSVTGSASCQAVKRENIGEPYNLLRARDLTTRLRTLCGMTGGLVVRCPAGTGLVNVTMSGNNVSISGMGTINASVAGDRPGDRQGAVVITNGDVRISGTLAQTARLLVIAATPSGAANYGTGSAPTAWIRNSGTVGAHTATTSSFGVVAEGDVVLDHTSACPITVRGALMSLTGMLSMHPTWRVPIATGGGSMCAGTATVQGSIVGHFPPALISPINSAGYQTRQYLWLNGLFDNPPPSYPTAGDWEITRIAQANLDCFTGSALNTATTKSECW
jgi:hypothetical protein